jgi:hypothetical protein
MYEAEEIADLEALLGAYDVDYLPYARFTPPILDAESTSRVTDPFFQWFLSEESTFEFLWES